jgi:hypothetical protein
MRSPFSKLTPLSVPPALVETIIEPSLICGKSSNAAMASKYITFVVFFFINPPWIKTAI